jgi:tetratricopeptide (TPR) repeat protein
MRRSSLVAGLALAVVLVAGPERSLAGQASDGRQQFVAANALYAQERYAEAAAGYEAALVADPTLAEAHFFLGNAYDNLYRPARRGEAANDRLLDAACANYQLAADRLTRPDQAVLRKRALQYLAAAYGRDKLDRPDDAAAVAEQLIALDPGDVTSYVGLAKIQEAAGRLDKAFAALERARGAAPDSVQAWTQLAYFHDRQNRFEAAMAVFDRVALLEPDKAEHPYAQAVRYEERVRRDVSLPEAVAVDYLARAQRAIDQALALRPDYFEALVYKNLLLRQEARFAHDPTAQARLLQEADQFQRRAIALREAQGRRVTRPGPP